MRDLRQLEDHELFAGCEMTAGETFQHKWGCLAALVMGAAVGWGVYACSRSWWVIGVAGFIVAFLAFIQLMKFADRRRRPYWKELERRYRTIDGECGAGLVVEVTGCGLPHGGYFAIRVSSATREMEKRTLCPLALPDDPQEVRCSAGTDALSAEESQRVTELAAAVTDERTEIDSDVLDGVPAEMVVRSAGKVIARAQCNLAGIPEALAEHPAVVLMRFCDELAERIGSPTMIYGAYNPTSDKISIRRQ